MISTCPRLEDRRPAGPVVPPVAGPVPTRTCSPWRALAGGAALLLLLGVLTGAVPLPRLDALVTGLSDALGPWTLLVVPLLAFLETAAVLGLLLPGETAVLVGGVVAERGEVSLPLLMGLVWAAAVTGDVAAFLTGRRLGRPFLRRHAGRLHLRTEHLDRVDLLFARHGGKAVVLGRFVGVLRAFTPFVAGTTGMALRAFLAYSAGSALVWAVVLSAAGYAFSDSVDAVGSLVTTITLAALAAAGLVLWVVRTRRSRAVAAEITGE